MLLCLSTRVRSEVPLVAFCEAGVVDDASFEFGDPVGCGSEGLGCAADGEPLSGALPTQVRPAGTTPNGRRGSMRIAWMAHL